MTNKSKLTSKPSALITTALADLVRAEKSPRYEINMMVFHNWMPGEKCEICLAGAVMAFKLGAKPDQDWQPCDFPRATRDKLEALSFFTFGGVKVGLELLGADLPSGMENTRSIPLYSQNPTNYKDAMRKLAADLKAKAL